jgi:flagellin
MATAIRSEIISQSIQNNLRRVSSEYEKELLRLSSGKRITSPGDDAAGLAIGQKLSVKIRSMRQAERNANEGLSLIQTAEGGLNEIGNILMRIRELAMEAATDTVGDEERALLQIEYKQLFGEIDRTAQITAYQGINLINGSRNKIELHVGPGTTPENRLSIDASNLAATTKKLGLDPDGVGSLSDAKETLENVDSALSSISAQRATLGAFQNRLNITLSTLGALAFSHEQGRSAIEDTDYAQAASRMARLGLIQDIGICVLAQTNNLNSRVLKLLGQ